jgi:hypothetical protein
MKQDVEAYKVVRRRGSQIFLGNRLTDGGEAVSFTRQAIPVTGCGGP